MFLQYFSSTSNCVNVLSESDDLVIRGVVNLYFNELYMHANAALALVMHSKNLLDIWI